MDDFKRILPTPELLSRLPTMSFLLALRVFMCVSAWRRSHVYLSGEIIPLCYLNSGTGPFKRRLDLLPPFLFFVALLLSPAYQTKQVKGRWCGKDNMSKTCKLCLLERLDRNVSSALTFNWTLLRVSGYLLRIALLENKSLSHVSQSLHENRTNGRGRSVRI